jgi:hypothetical protein
MGSLATQILNETVFLLSDICSTYDRGLCWRKKKLSGDFDRFTPLEVIEYERVFLLYHLSVLMYGHM